MNKLINISEATSIAIHSLAIISRKQITVNALDLSELTGFSKNHISKVLQVLVKQGYISSARGPHGGFRLQRDVDDIPLLEIYELFDGKVNPEYCRDHKEMCPFENCEISEIIDELTAIFLQRFKNLTIGRLKFVI